MEEIERYSRTYYPMYDDGHLLVAGGVGDQPARYLEMIVAIRNLVAQSELKFLELNKEPEK